MSTRLAAHFHEIALKGGNRPRFERALRENLEKALAAAGDDDARVASRDSRVFVDTALDKERALDVVKDVFGVAHTMPIERFAKDTPLEVLAAHITDALRARQPANFRVTTRRSDKRYPLASVEVDRAIGAMVQRETGVSVKLRAPDLNAFVYVLEDEILVGTEKTVGVGGLPVGTSGRMVTLLSGGIDSPVAAWRMMKRGCVVDLVHFHSHPIVDRTSIDKARDLASALSPWQHGVRLFLIPLADIQRQIKLDAPDSLRVVLYRRFMVRLAELIARRHKGKALVTGEALGQVASQTIQNLAAIDAVSTLPILRPLIGMDKNEIIEEAKRIGTVEISNEPDQDACKLFLPESPEIHASDAMCREAEAKLDVDELVFRAVDQREVERF